MILPVLGRGRLRAGVIGLVAVAMACGLISAVTGGAPQAGAEAAVTVAAAPTAVSDGQLVTVTVKAPAGTVVYAADVNICRPGATFGPGSGNDPPNDFAAGPDCPPHPANLSTSGDGRRDYSSTILSRATQPAGATFRYQIGAGTAKWTVGGKAITLTCDGDNSCDLVVELLVSQGATTRWQPFKQRLTYAGNDPFAGCGGPAAGVLNTGASDRMTDSWVSWTVAECTQPGRKGAAGRSSFAGEAEAVQRFAAGTLDLAYTGGGYDDDVRLAPPDAGSPGAGRRAAVAVPTAVNAAVLAVAGGDPSSGVQVPYDDIKLTIAEVARLVSGGTIGFDKSEPPIDRNNGKSYVDLALARNPQLKGQFFSNDDAIRFKVGAGADASMVTWYATRMFTRGAPDAWHVPNAAVFGDNAGKARGVDLSLGANPAYAGGPELLLGRPALVRGLEAAARSPFQGGTWVLTDLATAEALGLTPVQIENANGQFVAPTPEAMAAAVPKMVRDTYGVLISDPKASAAAGQAQPYPLTFVEYALAPAEPLLAEDCSTRDQSQTLLKAWLQYITGPGQEKLAAGMVPLTADLRGDASKAVAMVGASEVTGTCKETVAKNKAAATTTTRPKPTTTTVKPAASTSTPPLAGPAGPVPEPATGSFEAGSPLLLDAGAVAPPAAGNGPAPPAVASPTTKPTTVDIPAYGGKAATAYTGTAIGLVGILGMAALAAVGGVPMGRGLRRRRAADSPPAPPGARRFGSR